MIPNSGADYYGDVLYYTCLLSVKYWNGILWAARGRAVRKCCANLITLLNIVDVILDYIVLCDQRVAVFDAAENVARVFQSKN